MNLIETTTGEVIEEMFDKDNRDKDGNEIVVGLSQSKKARLVAEKYGVGVEQLVSAIQSISIKSLETSKKVQSLGTSIGILSEYEKAKKKSKENIAKAVAKAKTLRKRIKQRRKKNKAARRSRRK